MKTLKKLMRMLLAIVLPWAVLLAHDNPGGAFVALVMQASVIGWPFASAWAWKILSQSEENAKKE